MSHIDEPKGERVRDKETEKTISRVRQLMKLIHTDLFPADTSEEIREASKTLTPLLDEILKHPHDLGAWSDEVYEHYQGKELTLAGLEPKKKVDPEDAAAVEAEEARVREVRPIFSMPLPDRPDMFLNVLEAYLAKGKLTKTLREKAAAPREESGEQAEESEDQLEVDSTLRMFENGISNPDSFDQLLGLRAATVAHPVLSDHHRIVQRLDEVAEKMIAQEIALGTPDALQRANAYLNEEYPFRKNTLERLRSQYEAKKAEKGAEDLVMPTNVSDFEAEAAAAETIEDLAKIAQNAVKASANERKSIDTMAKNLFSEQLDASTSLEDYLDAAKLARTFPFSNEAYGDDVKEIIEARAKHFAVSNAEKLEDIELINQFEDEIRKFPFRHGESLTAIQNEIVSRRESLRGNPGLSAQQLPASQIERQETRSFNQLLNKAIDRLFGR